METIRYRYNGQNVYTPSNQGITRRDLSGAKREEAQIEDAYFFTVDEDRQVHRAGFNRKEVEANRSGLMVDVNNNGVCASLAISGLDRIVDFMDDAGVFGKDLAELKGRPVTTYNRGGISLIGISLGS